MPDLRFQISGNGEKRRVWGYCAAPDAEFDISDFKERHICEMTDLENKHSENTGIPRAGMCATYYRCGMSEVAFVKFFSDAEIHDD